MRRFRKKIQNKVTNFGDRSCRSLRKASFSNDLLCFGACLALAVAFIWSNHSAAQIEDPTSVSATRTNKKVRQEKISYGAEFNVETYTGINQAEEHRNVQGQYSASFGMSFPQYQLSTIANFGWQQEYSYARDDGRDGDWSDPSVAIIKTVSLKNSVIDSIAFSGRGTAAMNKESKLASYRGTLGGSVSLQKRFNRFYLSQSFGYSRSFFEYDIRDDGVVNSPDNYSTSTSASYSIGSKWLVGAMFRYSYAVSFQKVGKGRELFNIFLAHRFTKNFAVTGGLMTSRGTLLPDGQTNQLRFIDPNSTYAYLNLGLSI